MSRQSHSSPDAAAGGPIFCCYCGCQPVGIAQVPDPDPMWDGFRLMPRPNTEIPYCAKHSVQAAALGWEEAVKLQKSALVRELQELSDRAARRARGLHREKRARRLRDTERESQRRRRAEEQNLRKAEEEKRARLIEEQRRLKEDRLEEERRLKEDRLEHERRREEEERRARAAPLIARLKQELEDNFLSVNTALDSDPDRELISADEFQKLKVDYVREWAHRELQFRLDPEQAAAVAAVGGDVRVVARAGSGKTRTLVTRALFLQKHCGVSPGELLLLAFNKKAADEMKARVAKVLGKSLPHVMTFHALAYAVVKPEGSIAYDDPSEGNFGHSREVQNVIDEHIRSGEHGDRIRNLMLAFFREDWERIVAGKFQLTTDDFLDYRRALSQKTLNGDYVKSYGEKTIANALFENAVRYGYEWPHGWGEATYRPDFTIPRGTSRSEGGVIIEYFGKEGDAKYDKESDEKRQYWSAIPEWTLLEFSPRDLRNFVEHGFVEEILRRLHEAGISSRRLSEQEIWRLIKDRALDDFTEAMSSFVRRCTQLNMGPADLADLVKSYFASSDAERLFLNVGKSVHEGYLQRLKTTNQQDFDKLVWSAVKVICAGRTTFVRDRGQERGDVAGLRYILIDEFQDFSEMFYGLAKAIRTISPKVQFFCVGDDWQAINGFAGSDLRFFNSFHALFQDASMIEMPTNYRSARSIVRAGNALMHGLGTEARASRTEAGSAWICDLDKYEATSLELERHDRDKITPATLRLVSGFLKKGLDVVILSRTNSITGFKREDNSEFGRQGGLGYFLNHVRSFLPKESRSRVTISTTHSYKGKEEEAVVVLDATAWSYPLVHPLWVFQQLFGDTIEGIEAEEKRLFYVAITRARDSVAVVTESSGKSPFLIDIEKRFKFDGFSWGELSPPPSLDGERLEVCVSRAFAVRNLLKGSLGYRWDSTRKCWHKLVRAEGFSFDSLVSQPWVRVGVIVEVYTETGGLLHTNAGSQPGGPPAGW